MSPRLKLFIPLALFASLAVLLFRGLSLDPQALPSALVDKPLPTFDLPVLSNEMRNDMPDGMRDGDGTVGREVLTGRVSLLNVWATWCISCRVEHPYLQQLADGGVTIVGLNYKDDVVSAKDWLANLGDPYTLNIVDEAGTLGLDLGVYGAPETFFIDREGVVRYRHVGVIDERIWTTRLEPIYQSLVRGDAG